MRQGNSVRLTGHVQETPQLIWYCVKFDHCHVPVETELIEFMIGFFTRLPELETATFVLFFYTFNVCISIDLTKTLHTCSCICY